MKLIKKINLEPTAAFVLHYSKEVYINKTVKEYLKNIDLTSADNILKMCKNKNIEHLLFSAMSNRKYMITKLVLDALRTKKYKQIVIFASGKSPLSMEIVLNVKDDIIIYEIDNSSLKEKQSVYKNLLKNSEYNKINFLEADITSSNLKTNLKKINYDSNLNTVLVFEGITHYIKKNNYKSILVDFSNNKKNKYIIEYSPDINLVTADYKYAVKEVFSFIENNYFTTYMTNYSKYEFEELFKSMNGEINNFYDLQMISKLRNKEILFQEKNFIGPIEIIEAEA